MIRTVGLRPSLPALAGVLLMSGCSMLQPQRPYQPPPAPTPAPVATEPALSPRMAAAAESLSKMAAMQDRLYQVGAPLLINNAELCKAHARNLLGFTAKNRYSYPGEYNDAAHVAFGMGERLQVSGVLAGSGAARAGLRRGDTLLTAEGKTLPSGPNAETAAASVFAPIVAAHAAIKLSLERDGANQVVSIPVTRACAFRVELGNSDNVNSYADGNRVLVTRAMLQFAQGDEELAYVLAKGMAHNILGHAAAQRLSSTLAGVIDNLTAVKPDTSLLIGSGGIRAMPAEMDAQGDTLALYLLARAGYNIDNAAKFWQRLAATYPATVLNGYVANHPSTAARVTSIEKVVGEIKSKQASKKPLMP